MSKCARGMKGAVRNERGHSGCLEHGATEALAASWTIRVAALATPAAENERQKPAETIHILYGSRKTTRAISSRPLL